MISVCLATHNGEKYLRQQMDSILSQLAQDDELIVSDDGSVDGTLKLLEDYCNKDKRVRVVTLKQTPQTGSLKSFKYASRNFENAMKEAKGDYIFLSDQDDEWHPEKVKTMLSSLQENVLVRTNSLLVTVDGEPIRLSYEEGETPLRKGLAGNIKAMRFSGSHMAFRKEVLDAALPFPKGLVSHDNWIGCLALLMGKCVYEPKPLLYYRMHGNNVSKYHKNSLFVKISYRLTFLRQLTSRILKIKLRNEK